MILIDLSQAVISTVLAISKDIKESDDPKNLIKHAALNVILSYAKKYGSEYGETVLATDGKAYWRKEYFPHYKGQRKHARADSTIDWATVFDAINELKDDLQSTFRWKVIRHNRAEADDIVAVLTKWLQDNQLEQSGMLYTEPQKILLISSDGDFSQLQKYPNVRQWSPMQKKYVTIKMDPKEWINEHITEGDNGDNIPNILTGDDWAQLRAENSDDKIRATPLKKARKDEFRTMGIDACQNDTEKRNWQRNQKLIDFDYIPEDLAEEIIDQYSKYEVQGSRMKIMNYFVKHRMKQLMESIGDF